MFTDKFSFEIKGRKIYANHFSKQKGLLAQIFFKLHLPQLAGVSEADKTQKN